MAEHQELQILHPFEDCDWKDTLPLEVNYIIETLYIWFKFLICYDENSFIDCTEEFLLLVEEQKQQFFNEIGLDEDTLKYVLKQGFDFFARVKNTSTEEEFQSVWEERNRFLKDNENFTAALDKYVQEKKQKSTAPAA